MVIYKQFIHGSYYAFVDGMLWRISRFSCKEKADLVEILQHKLYG